MTPGDIVGPRPVLGTFDRVSASGGDAPLGSTF